MSDGEIHGRQGGVQPLQQRPGHRAGRYGRLGLHSDAAIQPRQRRLRARISLIIDLENLPARAETALDDVVQPRADAVPGFSTQVPGRPTWQRWKLRKAVGLAEAYDVRLLDLFIEEKGQCRSEERRVGKECRSRWSPYQ